MRRVWQQRVQRGAISGELLMVVVVVLVLAVLAFLIIAVPARQSVRATGQDAVSEQPPAARASDYAGLSNSDYHAAAVNELMEMQPSAAGASYQPASGPADDGTGEHIQADLTYLIEDYRCHKAGKLYFCPGNDELLKKPGLQCRGDERGVVCRVLAAAE